MSIDYVSLQVLRDSKHHESFCSKQPLPVVVAYDKSFIFRVLKLSILKINLRKDFVPEL